MSLLQIVTIYDRAVEAYGRPVFVSHNGEAIRSFTDEANDSTSNIGKHPHDYELFAIGVYDTDTAAFTQNTTERLARASDLVKQS